MFEELYENIKYYFFNYGSSLFITIFILIISIYIIIYIVITFYLKNLKSKWSSIRCNPLYIPFVSMINKPQDKSSLDFTAENFSYCTSSILKQIVSDFLAPIYYVYNVINSSVSDVKNDIQKVRQRIYSIVQNIENIDKSIMGKVFSSVIPLQHNLIKMRTIIEKAQSIGLTSVYTTIAGYFSIITIIKVIVNLAIGFLIMLTAAIVPLLIFIFTIPIAAPLLVLFGVIASLLLVVIIGLQPIIHKVPGDIPKKPHCFDENTLLEMKQNMYKKIKNVKVGDVLKYNGTITSIFKVLKGKNKMYSINGIIVSEDHSIYRNGTWITSKEHPDAKLLHNYTNEYIYCLNTESGTITIDGIVFSDWNDIEGHEYYFIKKYLEIYNKKQYNLLDLHKDLEYGFFGQTQVELLDGNSKQIQKLELNDILINGEIIIGLVETNCKNLDYYYYPKFDVFGSTNLSINDNDLGKYNTYVEDNRIKVNTKPKKLYNILTNTGTFYICGICFNDYNGGLEKILEKKNYIH